MKCLANVSLKALFGSKKLCIHFSFSLSCVQILKLNIERTHFHIWGCLVNCFEYIIWVKIHHTQVWHCFLFKKKSYFFHLHTSIRWGPLYFTIFTKLPLYSFSMKMNTMKKCFHFLYSNPTFWILKMKTEYKFLNQTSFFVVDPIEN